MGNEANSSLKRVKCLSINTNKWFVFSYVCVGQIDGLLRDGRVPVIVGGTHYYIESLLWKVLLDDDGGEQTARPLLYERDEQLRRERPLCAAQSDDDEQLLKLLRFDDGSDGPQLQHLTSGRLHRLLNKVDPVMADAIHPNNRRKIVR